MIQQPKLCGQRQKLNVGAKIQSRGGGEQTSEHLRLLPRRAWTEGMATRDAGSAVGFRPADKGLQTPHGHNLFLSNASSIMEMGATCFFDKAGFPLRHDLYFLFQTVRPCQTHRSPCQKGDGTQGQGSEGTRLSTVPPRAGRVP